MARPERSPFTSATKHGTPAAENPSMMPWMVTVLPVPVAPAISPWRLARLSSSCWRCPFALLPMKMLVTSAISPPELGRRYRPFQDATEGREIPPHARAWGGLRQLLDFHREEATGVPAPLHEQCNLGSAGRLGLADYRRQVGGGARRNAVGGE